MATYINLYNKDTRTVGYTLSGGTLSRNNSYDTSDYIEVQPNTTYYIYSHRGSATSDIDPSYHSVAYFDANFDYIDETFFWDSSLKSGNLYYIGRRATVTTPASAAYIRTDWPHNINNSSLDYNMVLDTDYVSQNDWLPNYISYYIGYGVPLIDLTVSATSYKNKITLSVSPSLTSGNHYRIKPLTSGQSDPTIGAGDDVSSWTIWNGSSTITNNNYTKIAVVEADSNNQAAGFGINTISVTPVPSLGSLTVSASRDTGVITLSVTPSLTYSKYKIKGLAANESEPTVEYDDDISSWTNWDGNSTITNSSYAKIVVAEADSNNLIKKYGISTITEIYHIESLTVAASRKSNQNNITANVSPSITSGNIYKVKGITSSEINPSISYDDDVSSWTSWDGTSTITNNNYERLAVVEATSNNKARKYGIANIEIIEVEEWTTTTQVPTATKRYLWTYQDVEYSDGTHSYIGPSIVGVHGEDGTGIDIEDNSVMYVASVQGTTPPSAGWQNFIPAVSEGEYLWTKTTVEYDNGTSTESYSVARWGKDGADTTSKYVTYIDSSYGVRVYSGIGQPNNYAQVNSNGLSVVKGGENVAAFGDAARLGKTNNYNLGIDTNGFYFNNNNTLLAKLTNTTSFNYRTTKLEQSTKTSSSSFHYTGLSIDDDTSDNTTGWAQLYSYNPTVDSRVTAYSKGTVTYAALEAKSNPSSSKALLEANYDSSIGDSSANVTIDIIGSEVAKFTSDGLSLLGHNSPVGTVLDVYASQSKSSSTSYSYISGVQLSIPAGSWVISYACYCDLGSSSKSLRCRLVNNTSGSEYNSTRSIGHTSNTAAISLTGCLPIAFSSSQTIRLEAAQNSGSSKSITGYIRAIRIA